MRQRLALAAALLGDPDYLILDEPANGLDPEGIRWLRGFLREFADSGRVVLVSSHLLNEVQATVDEIVVINKGRLLAQMPISDLQLGQGTTRVRVSDPEAAVTRSPGSTPVSSGARTLRAPTFGSTATRSPPSGLPCSAPGWWSTN